MNAFSKADEYRNAISKSSKDIIDLKFPSELKGSLKKELLVFVVEDDAKFMLALNSHLKNLVLNTNGLECVFKIRNFATGRSCLNQLNLAPDLIFLNYEMNKGLPNRLTGAEIMDHILKANVGQKIIILNDLKEEPKGAFVKKGLRNHLMNKSNSLCTLIDAVTLVLTS